MADGGKYKMSESSIIPEQAYKYEKKVPNNSQSFEGEGKMKFIAELHDIGKLVDKEPLNQAGIQIPGHTFYNFDFSQIDVSPPSSPSWYAQYLEKDELRPPDKDLLNSEEAKKCISDAQIRANVLLTKIADGISASISRLELYGRHIRRGQVSEGVHKLWNPEFYEKQKRAGMYWSPFTNLKSFKVMFQYIDSCRNYKNFFRDYGEYLSLTPEDKTSPGNIVTLNTHLELVGKIYRTLKRHSLLQSQNTRNVLIYNNQPIKNVREACGHLDLAQQPGRWVFRIISCNIKFFQSFSRLQDLNIFRKRADSIKTFSEGESTKDYVLFFTDDFMCLFIPREEEVEIQKLLEPLLKDGFMIDYKEIEAELNLLTSSIDRTYQRFHSLSTTRYLKLYEKMTSIELPPKIQPPLCDSCQIRQGKEWSEFQSPKEFLCEICYNIRKIGEPASNYAKWEGKASWMKITLDQNQLKKTIQRLFEEYVDTHPTMQGVSNNDKAKLKEAFRPLAVQMDFVKDYKLLLKAFNEMVYEIKDKEGNPFFTKETFLYPIDGYYEFGIFKVYSGEDILRVIDLFLNLMEDKEKGYFPECFKDSPIKLSLSVAQVKYPYQEHWRFLSMPENIINIQSSWGAKLDMDIIQYKLLRGKIRREDPKLSHFLHRLADIEIETRSNIIAMLEILEKRKKFPALLEIIHDGLTVRQVLDFYKLTQE